MLLLGLAAVPVSAGEAKKVIYSGHDVCDIITINDTRMIPVRAVAEALGYTVEWLPDTKEIAVSQNDCSLKMKISEDSYSLCDLSEISLGAAPIISNGSTYVPLTLLTEIMQEKTVFADNAVTVFGSAVITSVKSSSVTVNDKNLGEVVLYIDDYVKITNEDGETLAPSKLVSDTKVYVDYGTATTMSIPPTNTPTQIIIYE